MNQKVRYKTSDGTLKEQFFDDFNEFADSMESIANQYYQGLKTPQVNVETVFDDGLIRKENVTNVELRDGRATELLNEIGQQPQE
jgi:hypothetical protein